MEKIKFKDLSWTLKTLVILGWMYLGFYILLFVVAFMVGIIEALAI